MSPRRQAATNARTTRREALLVLLSRAERGALAPAEATLLRSTVEAELADADTARRSAGGQQAANRRAQQRIGAAEQVIREIEAERDDLAERLVTAAQLASALTDHLPGEAWNLAEAVRVLCAEEISTGQALDAGERAA